MSAFQPKDERSKAVDLYEAVSPMPTNRVIAHDEEGLPCRLDENSSTVATVSNWMERDQQRTLESVKGVGYKIVAGPDHVVAARRRLRRAQKGARRAYKSASTVDRSEMDPVDRMRADEVMFQTAAFQRAANQTSRRMSPKDILAAQ
jgi:hypothetical protein